jgi:K+/H+ antiporter YhaU regulatory subunit KhtT
VYKKAQKIKDGMRFCPRCQELGRECWHPLENYNKNTHRKDKLGVYCRTCEREKQAIFRSEHPERAEKYRQVHEERYPGIASVYRKRSYRKHRIKRMQESRRWQQRNSVKWNAYSRDWRAKKKEAQG